MCSGLKPGSHVVGIGAGFEERRCEVKVSVLDRQRQRRRPFGQPTGFRRGWLVDIDSCVQERVDDFVFAIADRKQY